MAPPRQTHCQRGHEFTPENTYVVVATGARRCRACARASNRALAVAKPKERKTGTCECGAAIGRRSFWDGTTPTVCAACDSTACLIDGCNHERKRRGLCGTHYQRWKAHGDPETVLQVQRPRGSSAELAFWPRVERTDECWVWRGARDSDGYGKLSAPGTTRAHRFSYELLVGPIPDGLTLDHLCRNTSCVNPAHLEPVTLEENIRRSRVARAVYASQGSE